MVYYIYDKTGLKSFIDTHTNIFTLYIHLVISKGSRDNMVLQKRCIFLGFVSFYRPTHIHFLQFQNKKML